MQNIFVIRKRCPSRPFLFPSDLFQLGIYFDKAGFKIRISSSVWYMFEQM
jgi:hypothetical protein